MALCSATSPRHASGALLLTSLLALLLTACSPQQLVLRNMADQLAAQGAASEDDLELARDASAFYLKLSEAVLRGVPDHAGLAAATAGGFTQYAYAFVAFEADRLDSRDARAAQRLRERAARLYRRGRDHALTALESRHPGFLATLRTGGARQLEAADLPLAYWGAAAWGAAISLSKDAPDAVADLPLAYKLATLAWQADPAFGQGDLASLMGSFEAARPGGSPARALAYFDEALRLSSGHGAGVLVAKAESIAQPAGDKEAFLALLRQAEAVRDEPGSPRSLANEVMRRRARWLIDNADDLF